MNAQDPPTIQPRTGLQRQADEVRDLVATLVNDLDADQHYEGMSERQQARCRLDAAAALTLLSSLVKDLRQKEGDPYMKGDWCVGQPPALSAARYYQVCDETGIIIPCKTYGDAIALADALAEHAS